MDVNKKSDTRDHHIQDVFGAKSSGKQKEKSRGGELGQGFPSRSRLHLGEIRFLYKNLWTNK
jgi:hypothetical protein